MALAWLQPLCESLPAKEAVPCQMVWSQSPARAYWQKKLCPVKECGHKHHPLLHKDYVLKFKFFEDLGRGFTPEEMEVSL